MPIMKVTKAEKSEYRWDKPKEGVWQLETSTCTSRERVHESEQHSVVPETRRERNTTSVFIGSVF